MSKKRLRLGSEQPLCDSIQLAMLISYFAVLGADSLGHFVFGVSTVFVGFASFPLLLFPAFLLWSLGIYLALKSHEAVFGEMNGQPKLIDSGVYSWVRHPMYLGTLMFCLGFLFIMPSLPSFGVWIAFFIFYDKMATYEEKNLIHILGGEYGNYQKRVPEWFPAWQRTASE